MLLPGNTFGKPRGLNNDVAGCWFASDRVRLLVNFIPRWLIIVIILGLYWRLYRLIYKAHNRFMSFQDEQNSRQPEPHSISPETESVSSTRHIGRPLESMNIQSKDGTIEAQQSVSVSNGNTHARPPSPMLKKLARQMMMYPLVYMLIWTIPTSIRIYQSVTKKSAPFGIATVDKVGAFPIHPSLDCLVARG